RPVSDRRGRLAPRLDARDTVLRVSPRSAPRDLHDQCTRERPFAAAQDHQDPRPFPERRSGDQAALVGAAQHHGDLGARRRHLEGGHESVRDPVCGSLHDADDADRVEWSASRGVMHARQRARRRAHGRCRPVDAKNAPTRTWKTAQNAVSHSAHTHHRIYNGREDRRTKTTTLTRLTHEIPDTPRGARSWHSLASSRGSFVPSAVHLFYPGARLFHPVTRSLHPVARSLHPGSRLLEHLTHLFRPGARLFHPALVPSIPSLICSVPSHVSFIPSFVRFIPALICVIRSLIHFI